MIQITPAIHGSLDCVHAVGLGFTTVLSSQLKTARSVNINSVCSYNLRFKLGLVIISSNKVKYY